MPWRPRPAGSGIDDRVRAHAADLWYDLCSGIVMPRWRSYAFVALIVLARAAPLRAQSVEVAPFGGVRFGGGFFEASTGLPIDSDGAPAVGLTVDIPLSRGLQIEAAFSHQRADVFVPGRPFTPAARARITVDHWQAGGLQEYLDGRARPFLTGVLGLTHYASGGDNEVRFTAGAGGGVKLFPVPHLGVRLDGRVFATILDADGTRLACANQTCLVGLHLNVAWQAEFTAGLVVRLR
jgi:hypothetical protein